MHIHTHHSAADPHFPSFEQRMQAMFYDEEDYLGLVLPHFSWRGLPKEFWWNYRKGIVPSKALKLMISLTEKSDGKYFTH